MVEFRDFKIGDTIEVLKSGYNYSLYNNGNYKVTTKRSKFKIKKFINGRARYYSSRFKVVAIGEGNEAIRLEEYYEHFKRVVPSKIELW